MLAIILHAGGAPQCHSGRPGMDRTPSSFSVAAVLGIVGGDAVLSRGVITSVMVVSSAPNCSSRAGAHFDHSHETAALPSRSQACR